MITFLIPIKHPKFAKSWQSVSKLLAATLRSILNQSNDNFKIVVICNAMPHNAIISKFIKYLIVNLPCPDELCEQDKTNKILLGFASTKSDYYMVCDADDFVHKHLVGFVLNNPDDYGYYSEQGYIKNEQNLTFLHKDFQEYCGSALIIKANYFLEFISERGYLHTKKTKLKALPFSGAIYNICNGENFVAQQTIKQPVGSADVQFVDVPVTQKIIKDFNLRM